MLITIKLNACSAVKIFKNLEGGGGARPVRRHWIHLCQELKQVWRFGLIKILLCEVIDSWYITPFWIEWKKLKYIVRAIGSTALIFYLPNNIFDYNMVLSLYIGYQSDPLICIATNGLPFI